jgi:hypothetical protein
MIVQVELEAHTCPSCGAAYGLSKIWMESLSRQHDRGDKDVKWYCPNGHTVMFSREAESVVLRRERDRLKQENARLEQEALEALAAQHAAELKVKQQAKRAAAGTCPCCHRTFRQLSVHMRHKHPEAVREAQAHA